MRSNVPRALQRDDGQGARAHVRGTHAQDVAAVSRYTGDVMEIDIDVLASVIERSGQLPLA